MCSKKAARRFFQRREDAVDFVYGNDRTIFDRTTMPYVYLGRVHQHYHRYYDVYARADLGVPPGATLQWSLILLEHGAPIGTYPAVGTLEITRGD